MILHRDLGFAFCFLLFFLVTVSQSAIKIGGQNVCTKIVSFRENYRQSYQVSYRQRSTYKCGFWNLKRCTRYRTVYRTSYRTATRVSYRKQYQCCNGWSQVGDQCTQAVCNQACVHGTCTRAYFCSCDPGYYGQRCDKDCPSNKWGQQCRHQCLCQNNAKCSPHNGTCTCTPGWEGQYCNKTCDKGYYGEHCKRNCTCLNGGTCDTVSGNCTCAAGFNRQRCESRCSLGWYGIDCALKCRCLNGAACNHVKGTCTCRRGWMGSICNQKCPDGVYGYGCAQTCIRCMHGATCHHVTGVCQCLPGFKGKRCEHFCQEGTFGQDCQDFCTCQNNATCSHVNGSCSCGSGYKGKHCEYLNDNNSVTFGNYDKRAVDNNPLILSIAPCLSVLLVGSVAFGILIYWRKRKRTRQRTTDVRPDEPNYATAEVQRTGPEYETTEITGVVRIPNGDQEAVYQEPTLRPLTAVNINDVSYAAMETQYMDLNHHRNLDPNNYQPLSRRTKKKKTPVKPATYDVPVNKDADLYEVVKIDHDCHYYKSLEFPSKCGVAYVATKPESIQPKGVDLVENKYKDPDIIKRDIKGEEATSFATPD